MAASREIRSVMETSGLSEGESTLLQTPVYLSTHCGRAQSLLINHSALNRMSISNLNKSGRMTMLFVLRVPVVTPVAKITSLCEAIKAYATEAATEWAAFDLLFDDIVNNEGHLSLKIWAESRFLAHEVVPIYEAKSRLVLFMHTYMQAASIDYVQPLLPTARVA